MSDTVLMLTTILPVIIMLIIGMVCRYKNVIGRGGIDTLRSFATQITLPAMLFNAFSSMEYTVNNVLLTLLMYGVCILCLLAGHLFRVVFRERSKYLPYLSTGFEAGMLGYSLYIMLYGQGSLGLFATVDLGQCLFVFTLYKILLGRGDSDVKYTGRQMVSDIFRSPIIIAIIAGIIFGATGLYGALLPSGVTTVISTCADFISAPTAAVILLTIGYDFVLSDLPWKNVMKFVISRVLIMLGMRLLMGAAVRLLGFGNILDPALNIMFITPPPYVLPVFVTDRTESNYISSSLTLYTLLTIIAFVVLTILGV